MCIRDRLPSSQTGGFGQKLHIDDSEFGGITHATALVRGTAGENDAGTGSIDGQMAKSTLYTQPGHLGHLMYRLHRWSGSRLNSGAPGHLTKSPRNQPNRAAQSPRRSGGHVLVLAILALDVTARASMSIMNPDPRAERGDAVQPLRERDRRVDAAVAHHLAEVVVPVGAVNGVAAIGEVHRPRHIGHVVVLAAEHALHVVGWILDEDVIGAGGRVKARASGADIRSPDHRVAAIHPHVLAAQVDIDPELAAAAATIEDEVRRR